MNKCPYYLFKPKYCCNKHFCTASNPHRPKQLMAQRKCDDYRDCTLYEVAEARKK